MEQKKIYSLISALLVSLMLAACSPRTVSPTPIQSRQARPATNPAPNTEATGTVAVQPSTPAAGGALCTNAFYPVRQGATWNYKSSGGPAGEYSFTDTITAVRSDGFTLSTQMAGLTTAQDWSCTAEGLTAQQLGGAPTAMLNSQNIRMRLNAINSSGVTFPRQVEAGDSWLQSADVEGDITALNEEAEATGAVQMNFVAMGQESVTVPAGTFDALRVDVDVTLNVNTTYEGITLPVAFTGDYTYWFVEGVGWVKASGTGSFLGNAFSETTELQSYSIP